MNIFYLDRDPRLCARYHCDKHVVKMTLETAQILSTLMHEIGPAWFPEVVRLYKPTHVNHPCVRWAIDHDLNRLWLCRLGMWLATNYRVIYSKAHASEGLIRLITAFTIQERQLQGPWEIPHSDPPQAMPVEYQGPDAVEAYRLYYFKEKRRFARWTRREKPSWFEELERSETDYAHPVT